MAATLECHAIAPCAGCRDVKGVHSTRSRTDTPSRSGGGSRREPWISDEQARSCTLGSSETETARWRKLDLIHHADDERETLRAQPLLHRPQGIGCTRRLGEQPHGWLEAECSEARTVGGSELARE